MLTLDFAHGEAPRIGRKVNEWLDDRGEFYARAFSDEELQWIDWCGVGVFAFSPNSNGVQVWPVADAHYEAIADIFSRFIQPLILQASGWQLMHAGASIGPAGVVAFCGRSGSGKSTLAFAMQRAGWQQFADDALVLQIDDEGVTACPLPFRPRLRSDSRAHFAGDHVSSLSEAASAETPLAAVYVLRHDVNLTGTHVSLVPQAQAFSEVLAHAECFDAQEPKHTRRLVKSYLELVARVPVFTLAYRPDFQSIRELTHLVSSSVAGINLIASCESQSAASQN